MRWSTVNDPCELFTALKAVTHKPKGKTPPQRLPGHFPPRPRMPLVHPSLHKRRLIALRLPDRTRRQHRRRLVGKQPVLIPMMHRALNQDERFVNRIRPILRFSRRMRRRGSPGVLLPVYESQTGIADIVAAVLVDGSRVGRGGNVEGVAADDGFVLEGEGAGDEGELGVGDAGTGLEVAPLAAVLVGPAAPGLSDVVLGVVGGVVGGEAFVCRCAGDEAGLDDGYVEVADVVEHLRCEGCRLRGVATSRYQSLDCAC